MIDLTKLSKEQVRLAKKIICKDSFEGIKFIAGSDQAFFENKIISAVCVCKYDDLSLVEKTHAVIKSPLPYIPNYLSFREAPAVVEAYANLKHTPNIMLCDFNGILHPRKFGAACQVGLSLGIPTIGAAKNPIKAEIKDDKIYLDGELRGRIVRTKIKARPMYISPGHLISLKSAVEITKKCIKPPHKSPEPLHLAHRYAKKLREEYEHKKAR